MLSAVTEASAAPMASDGAIVKPFDKREAVVALDWRARKSAIYPEQTFDAIDLSGFHVADGSTLADHADLFKDRVREEMSVILEGVGVFDRVDVVDAAEGTADVETTILLTQSLSPTGRREIGRGNYDPCNEYEADEALIFGEQIRRLGDGYALDEWVTVFANVCAHEAAHTFGFGHVARDDIDTTERALYVELMLDGHTVSEMRRTQRMIHHQTNCPTADSTAAATHAATIHRCGHSH